MTHEPDMDVAAIVRSDYRTADIFKKYGINFCCSGNLSLAAACSIKNIDYNEVMEDIREATKNLCLPNNLRFDQWEPGFLIDYIINVHHAHLLTTLPALELQIVFFTESHKMKYPEFQQVADIFRTLSHCLQTLMRKEEEIIFPYIRQIVNTHRRKESYGNLFVRTLRKPLNSVKSEHEVIAVLLNSLQAHTHHFTFDASSCTNYQVLYHKLKAFNDDLLQHAHLENNILFPIAIGLEKELLQS